MVRVSFRNFVSVVLFLRSPGSARFYPGEDGIEFVAFEHADDVIEAAVFFFQLRAQAFGHAAHDQNGEVAVLFLGAETADAAHRAGFGSDANGTGIDDDEIGDVGGFGHCPAAGEEKLFDRGGFRQIHLAAVGFKKVGHREPPSAYANAL